MNRLVHAYFVLALVVSFNVSRIHRSEIEIHDIHDLLDVINYSFHIDYALFFSLLGVFAIVIFNLAWILRRVKLILALFIVSSIVINALGIMVTFGEDVKGLLLKVNLFLIINLIYTNFQLLLKFKHESEFVKRAFSQYIHPELLEELITSPDTLDLGGEQKTMTVLFCDLRGFTRLAEKLPPKFLIQLLNNYFDQMSQVIIWNGGTIDKYVGDAIMAFWGAPISDTRHAENAINASVQMMQTLQNLQAVYPEFKELKMGIGINSGTMIVGNVGSRRRFDYTVLGDDVNLGARLESLTKSYQVDILVSENVLASLTEAPDNLLFRLIDEILVKGKTQPIKIYQPMLCNEANQFLKERYEAGFYYYQTSQFDEAQPIFSGLKQRGDKVSQFMLERIATVQSMPSFDGIWNWNQQ